MAVSPVLRNPSSILETLERQFQRAKFSGAVGGVEIHLLRQTIERAGVVAVAPEADAWACGKRGGNLVQKVVDRSHSAAFVLETVEAYFSIIVGQQAVALPPERVVAEGLFLLQVASEVDRGLPPERDGGAELFAAVACALYQVAQAGVFEVDEVFLRAKIGPFADAAGGVDAGQLLRGEQFAKPVAAQLKILFRFIFKTGPQEYRFTLAFNQMPHIAVEQEQVGAGIDLGPVAADASGKLDDGTHRRGFDDGPVVIVVAPHFGDGRGENNKNLVLFRVPVELLTQFGIGEQGLRIVSFEQVVEALLDGRAHQQRVTRVIDAKMDALIGIRAACEQASGNQSQRVDVGHADEANADALAGDRVSLLIDSVQATDGRLERFGEVGANFFTAGARDVERQDFRIVADRGFAQASQALLDEGLMCGLIAADLSMVRSFGGEFIEPGTANLDCFLRSTAMLLKFCPAGAIGRK